ncbi:MAG: hypothetical protein Q9219_004782 [cf. Caloplaca sp. 3 TL-2023]
MASPAPAQASRSRQRKGGRGRVDGGYKIAGNIVPWDPDIDLDRPTPTPLFPVRTKKLLPIFPSHTPQKIPLTALINLFSHQTYKPPPPAPLTPTEKGRVSAFRSLRACIHEGPFYTILDGNARAGKISSTTRSASSAAAARFDPFEGMPTYSQKYMKKRRRLPKLSARPYELKYFPKELHPVLDPKNHKASSSSSSSTTAPKPPPTTTTTARRKKPQNTQNTQKDATTGDVSGDEEAGTAPPPAERDSSEEAMEEPIDDAFDDEDDDDGGDYNAEQYFDDGGDDMDDLDGGGGDGGDYY